MRPLSPDAPLVTARLILEPLVVAHAPLLYPHLRDESLYRYIPQDPPSSVAALTMRYRLLETRHSPDGSQVWLNWAARLSAEPAYIGTFQATLDPDGTALFAYMVFTPHQRQGYAREGGARILEHLTRDQNVSLVVAEIDTRNDASVGVVESLGFTRIAVRLAADFFKGEISDEYRYEYQPALP